MGRERKLRRRPCRSSRTAHNRPRRVLFYRDGNKFYLDKIWVKGWNYGFQFNNPGNSKKRAANQ